jgi:hypothetical protein
LAGPIVGLLGEAKTAWQSLRFQKAWARTTAKTIRIASLLPLTTARLSRGDWFGCAYAGLDLAADLTAGCRDIEMISSMLAL